MEIKVQKPGQEDRPKKQRSAPPPQARNIEGDAGPLPAQRTDYRPTPGSGETPGTATNNPDLGVQSLLGNRDPNPLPPGRHYATTEDPEEVIPDYWSQIIPFSMPSLPPELKARLSPIDTVPTYYWPYSTQFLPEEQAFKELQIRPFTTFDLMKVYEARQTKNRKVLLNTVQGTIDQPLHLLTFGDFWYVMHWLKLNSYTKSPTQIIWKCPACEAKYREARKIPATTPLPFGPETDQAFYNLERLMRTSQKIVDMPRPPTVPPHLDIPRMGCWLAYQDFLDQNEGDTIKLGTAALYVKGDAQYTSHDPNSFSGKFDTMNLSPNSLDILEDAQTLAILLHHGVEEAVRVRCQKEGCGAWWTVPMETDLLSFFP